MNHLWETIKEFIADYQEYLPESIPLLKKFPTPNEFLGDYVLNNLPFIVRSHDESDHLPAVKLWEDQNHVRKLMEKKMVTVAVTPIFRPDLAEEDWFLIPEERTMLFDDFFNQHHRPCHDQIYFLKKQNNLVEEFFPLVRDVGSHVPWATEAFGNSPVAANIWMGDHRSLTPIQKDEHESFYYVITGRKQFILYPPVCTSWMPYQKFKKFQYHYEKDCFQPIGKWNWKDLNEEIETISPSRRPPTRDQLMLYLDTKAFVVELHAGDVLYLPTLWFHEVCYTDRCIGVSYLYDTKLDMKNPFFNLLTQLCNMRPSRRNVSVDRQTELERKLYDELYAKEQKALKEETERLSIRRRQVPKKK